MRPVRRCAAALAGLLLCAPALGAEQRVRVRLVATSDAVQVGPASGPPLAVAPDAAGLRVGTKRVGPEWQLSGPLLRVDGIRVRGDVLVRRVDGGLEVVNRLPLEEYVAGTLGREIYPGWAPETLKAQAVVARTYALHQAAARAREPWDVAGDTAGQVYGGADAETPTVMEAVRTTRGEWLAWRGRPILAVYHSASGGRTASSEEVWGKALPYLISVPVDDEHDSPDTYWRATVPGTTLGRALAPLGVRVGPIRGLEIAERTASGRARTLRVQGRDGEAEIEARALRAALGAKVIRSTLFETRQTGQGIVFVGSGHGHGVGMSQWGAEAMARAGVSYGEILQAFYPGSRLMGSHGR